MSDTPSEEHANHLMSSVQASDASLRPSLHPLVLLTISDYITRHSLRRQTQPIVGVLLGQQSGRDVSFEHAFEVKLESASSSTGDVQLDSAWFDERLGQYREVHKDLDLVGWWTLCPEQGPSAFILDLQKKLMQQYNESLLLLGFHPEIVSRPEASGTPLPLTIYECVYERAKDEGKAMQVDGQENVDAEAALETRFRKLAYDIVTGEAEMIGVDFIAKGGGNATAVNVGASLVNGRSTTQPNDHPADRVAAGSSATVPTEDKAGLTVLTAEEDERESCSQTRSRLTTSFQSLLHLRPRQTQ